MGATAKDAHHATYTNICRGPYLLPVVQYVVVVLRVKYGGVTLWGHVLGEDEGVAGAGGAHVGCGGGKAGLLARAGVLRAGSMTG